MGNGSVITLILEVMQMIRFIKVLTITGFASVYLMQAPCTYAGHGFSIIPNPGTLFGALGGLIPG
jgi:hypothetical protein